MNTEEHRCEIIGDARCAIGTHLHAAWEIGASRRIEDRFLLCGGPDAREADDAIKRILRRRVGLAAQHRERRATIGPRESTIQRLLAIERTHDVGTEIAK